MNKCPNCNMSVSEFATAYPHCGKTIDKESVTKAIETQNASKKEISRKRQLSKLGKEKYLPLVMVIILILFRLVNEIQALSIVYDTLAGSKILETLIYSVAVQLILSSVLFCIIPISFLTKMYQSNKGYILKNIQMVIDVYIIFMSLIGVLSGFKNMNVMHSIQMLLLLLVFVTSLILCIRMGKKQNVHSDEKNETTE
jgi:hypothetical protein